MSEYPPGQYIAAAMQKLPIAGSDVPPQTVDIDAGPLWGRYRVSFVVHRNPRQGMRSWFWTAESGKQIAAATQAYRHYLIGEVLNEKAQWLARRILLSREDAAVLLKVHVTDLGKHPRAVELIEQSGGEVADGLEPWRAAHESRYRCHFRHRFGLSKC